MEKTDTRTLLVLKAIKLFKERGVDNVSTRDIVRGNNIKWCYRWGESDLLGDAKKALDTLFLPLDEYRLVK